MPSAFSDTLYVSQKLIDDLYYIVSSTYKLSIDYFQNASLSTDDYNSLSLEMDAFSSTISMDIKKLMYDVSIDTIASISNVEDTLLTIYSKDELAPYFKWVSSDSHLNSVIEHIDEFMSIVEHIPYDITKKVLSNYKNSVSVDESLNAILDKHTTRTTLISNDQAYTITSDMIRKSHISLGVEEYMWITSKDERVRIRHAELHGNIFDINKGASTEYASIIPDGGFFHPGDDINCRCVMLPIFDNKENYEI